MYKVQRFYKFYILLITIVFFSILSQSSQAKEILSINNNGENLITKSRSLSGGYLAGRFAQHLQDWDSAEDYMNSTLRYDKGNNILSQRAFLLSLGAGNFKRAINLAKKIYKSGKNELAIILLSCDAINREDFKEALVYLDKLPAAGFGQYTKPLLTAWALVGIGKKDKAIELLNASSLKDDPTYSMHKGLIEEFSNNMDKAAIYYKEAMANGLDLHTAIMVANFYDRYNHPEIADNIYKSLDKFYPFNPFTHYRSNKKNKKYNIKRVAEGAALAMFDLSSLLYSKRAYESAQIYGSLVKLLNKKYSFVKLMLGDIAALYNQYDKSIKLYNSIDDSSPVFWLSRTRVSEVYEISGNLDKSIEVLKDLSKETSIKTQILASIGDIYRRQNNFKKAIESYDEALSGVKKLKSNHWSIIYARGIAKEKLHSWSIAKKDIMSALKLQPRNPDILNHIAYNMAVQNTNLDKALEYVERAVSLQPNDGYILDSYGWILFRTGQYKNAADVLEEALAQISDSSTILDHLGDAYWKLGRTIDAVNQWRKAAYFSKDASFQKLVHKKMEYGIVVSDQIEHKAAKL